MAGQQVPGQPVEIALPDSGDAVLRHHLEIAGKRSNEFLLELDRAEDVRYIELREPIEKGQRISEYFIEWRDENGQWSGPFGTMPVGLIWSCVT